MSFYFHQTEDDEEVDEDAVINEDVASAAEDVQAAAGVKNFSFQIIL